jgi:hypothetical protein
MDREARLEQTCPVLIESEVGQGASIMYTLVGCQGWETTVESRLTGGYVIVDLLLQRKPKRDTLGRDVGHLRANVREGSRLMYGGHGKYGHLKYVRGSRT